MPRQAMGLGHSSPHLTTQNHADSVSLQDVLRLDAEITLQVATLAAGLPLYNRAMGNSFVSFFLSSILIISGDPISRRGFDQVTTSR